MKIAQINMVDYGSTGRIMLQIAEYARAQGHDVKTFSMKWKNQKAPPAHHAYFGSYVENGVHQVLGRITGKGGCYSYLGTKQLIRALKNYAPDIVHLHNLHNSYVNLKQLFAFCKQSKVHVVWTLHDCWSFTGKCPHFLASGCDKWKTGCHDCSSLGEYPVAKHDSTRAMWESKRKWYADMERLTLVTPSSWLASLVAQSFLMKRRVHVIHNGIDLASFRPTESDFREKCGIAHQKMILGVAFGWSNKKGLDDFIRLSKDLPHNYKIVLVGVDDHLKEQLPENILALGRTASKEELAKIYSAADVFVNPTKEENFPTVNIEAIACGTPVVTLNVGGCGEMLDEQCGRVVGSYEEMLGEIRHICEHAPFSRTACVARASRFSAENCVRDYLALYDALMGEK